MSHDGLIEIRIGLGSCGIAAGAQRVKEAIDRAMHEAQTGGRVKAVGCNGLCHREPLVEVVDAGGRRSLYGNVSPQQARRIVSRHLRARTWTTRLHWMMDDLLEVPQSDGDGHVTPHAMDAAGKRSKLLQQLDLVIVRKRRENLRHLGSRNVSHYEERIWHDRLIGVDRDDIGCEDAIYSAQCLPGKLLASELADLVRLLSPVRPIAYAHDDPCAIVQGDIDVGVAVVVNYSCIRYVGGESLRHNGPQLPFRGTLPCHGGSCLFLK